MTTDPVPAEPVPAECAPEGPGQSDRGSTVPDDDRATVKPVPRRKRILGQMTSLVRAINDGDEQQVEDAVIQLSQSRRIFAPLTLAVGALAMLFQGVRLLFSEWRLSLLQVLPAMWIWLAMMDLKVHALRGKEFQLWTGRLAVLVVLAIALTTMISFYLNAVFALAIARRGQPQIGPAFILARSHIRVILGVGFVVGAALGFSSIVVPRWGIGWFAIALGIVIGVMMFTYVTVPSRIIGMRANASTRDKLAATVVGGAVGALVCTPPYMVGRVGIVMLGSRTLFPLGVALMVVGFTLQAGATGAVKAVKMSAKLVAGNPVADGTGGGGDSGPTAAVSAGGLDTPAASYHRLGLGSPGPKGSSASLGPFPADGRCSGGLLWTTRTTR